MSKEQFKVFAQNHPELAQTVLSGNTSWQKLYEIYDIYGEKSSVWNELSQKTAQSSLSTFKDFFNTFKNIDMQSIQKGITNIQKTISLIQELGLDSPETQKIYEPYPIYKRFED